MIKVDSREKVLVISMGATMFLTPRDGEMVIGKSIDDVLPSSVNGLKVDRVTINDRSGAELQFSTILDVKNRITNSNYKGYVVITGTDSLDEFSYMLDLITPPDKRVVMTGAMKTPLSVGFDGSVNLERSIMLCEADIPPNLGVLVCMNETIHAPRYIRKIDTTLNEAFQSFPGPIAQFRNGQFYFYYTSLPCTKRYIHVSGLTRVNVPIITVYTNIQQDYSLEKVDGVVVAGMGTGSVPASLRSALALLAAEDIPVVISSRCISGCNFDEFYYEGSLTMYTSHGFILEDGYEMLNPMQARIRLILELNSPKKGLS